MREALRILALEGLLHRNLHRGVVVSQLSLRDLQEIYHLRRMLEIPAVLSARKPDAEITNQLRLAVENYESSVEAKDWIRAVDFDFQFHSLLIRFHKNKRLEIFYQKVIGELRMGMVLVDRITAVDQVDGSGQPCLYLRADYHAFRGNRPFCRREFWKGIEHPARQNRATIKPQRTQSK